VCLKIDKIAKNRFKDWISACVGMTSIALSDFSYPQHRLVNPHVVFYQGKADILVPVFTVCLVAVIRFLKKLLSGPSGILRASPPAIMDEYG
jgi:hypothetical protein